MDRRDFIRSSLVTAAGCGIGGAASSCSGAREGFFVEPDREIPLDDTADVVVAGGGPAGVACAVTAARGGLKTVLLESRHCLGGVWTGGLLAYVFDFDKSDVGWEIIRRLDELGARRIDRPPPGEGGHQNGPIRPKEYNLAQDWAYEPEYMKIVCEEMCAEAGVRVLLGHSVASAYRTASGRDIDTVVTESKSGRRAWRARRYVDCTGDGDLAFFAGCGFDIGRTADGTGQPSSLNALVVVKDASAITPYVSNEPAMWSYTPWPGATDGRRTTNHHAATLRILADMRRSGVEPSYGTPTLFRVHSNLLMFMVNHEYATRLDDAEAISSATMRARSEIHRLAAALAKLSGPWEGFRVAYTAEALAHRDARRIHGRYTLTEDDVAAGAKFPDAVTVSRFGIDVHPKDAEENRKFAGGYDLGRTFHPFEIPLRACRAKDVDNLYMAGRNISGDFISHASYRVTGSAVAMGEGVGRALAAEKKAL